MGSFLGKLDIWQRYPFFGQISAKKVQIIKHEWTPEIYKIKLYCIVIILYRMHTKKTPKKHTPPKAAAIRLTLLMFPMCTKPRARYQNSEPPNQRNRSQAVGKPARNLVMQMQIQIIIIIHFFRNWFPIRSINTEKFAFA